MKRIIVLCFTILLLFSTAHAVFAASGTWEINSRGCWYYFSANGIMQTGWLDLAGTRYYLDKNGAMVTGTKIIDGSQYTFDSKGMLLENTNTG